MYLSISFIHSNLSMDEGIDESVILKSKQLSLQLIMQKQLLSKPVERLQKSKSLQPIIGASAYVVNNSLYCSMQPKRASFDVKLFLQLHRKLIRKAVIEKTFEESLYQFANQAELSRKGFKGNLIPQHRCHNTTSHRQRRMQTQANSKLPQTTYANNSTHSTLGNLEQTRKANGVLCSHTKPNMMYNLSLYRKNYKRGDYKNDKACMKIIQNFSKTSEQFTRQSRKSKARKLLTIA